MLRRLNPGRIEHLYPTVWKWYQKAPVWIIEAKDACVAQSIGFAPPWRDWNPFSRAIYQKAGQECEFYELPVQAL